MSRALTLALVQLEVELLAALRALEEGEQGKTAVLLWDPHRLAAVLAHALGVEAPLVLTLYGEEEPRRYLVPPGNGPPPWRGRPATSSSRPTRPGPGWRPLERGLSSTRFRCGGSSSTRFRCGGSERHLAPSFPPREPPPV